jgi:TolB protein
VEDLDSGCRGFEWSPDGTSVLFVGKEPGRATTDLYVVAADGPPTIRRIGSDVKEVGASWSPDGDRIVFLRGERNDSREVVVVRADGTNEVVIATGVASSSPQWSPDGGSVAVVRQDQAGNNAIQIVPAGGGDPSASIPGFVRARVGTAAIAWQRVGD